MSDSTKKITGVKGCKIDFVQSNGQFPRGFENLPFKDGFHKAALRVGGGCGYADASVMGKLRDYVLDAFDGVNCLVCSGGTMALEEVTEPGTGRTIYQPTGFMVTMIPALLKTRYNVLAASTTPRTGQMYLGEDYGTFFATDSYAIDFRQDHAVVWQDDALEIEAGGENWVGDVLPFLNIHTGWQNKGVASAWWGIEGGGGTRKECLWYLEHGIPCILTRNSGRQSDKMITEFEAGTLLVRNNRGDDEPVDPSLITIVDFLDAPQLNGALRARGIIATSPTGGADTKTDSTPTPTGAGTDNPATATGDTAEAA